MAETTTQIDSWHSYPSIFNIGHRAIRELFDYPILVEEKVDGSQFSFAVDHSGTIHLRSKGSIIYPEAPEKMFAKAAETVKAIADKLTPGWTYRGEYLQKPKHNTLAYARTPENHIILFDINTGEADYLTYEQKAEEAGRIGLEIVPRLFQGMLTDSSALRALLDTESILGGQKIEGVVVKQITPTLFGQDKKVLIGKFVSETFKEIHQGKWKRSNPNTADIFQSIAESLKTEARWNNALIHLRERGLIEDSPKDIGQLMKEVPADIKKELEADIKQKLFDFAWPKICRQTTHGLPEWYKNKLLESQFDGSGSTIPVEAETAGS